MKTFYRLGFSDFDTLVNTAQKQTLLSKALHYANDCAIIFMLAIYI